MKMHRLAAGAALSLLLAAGALAQTQPVPGAVQANGQAAPVQATAIIVAPSGGGSGRGVVVAPDRPLPITCISGCSGGGGGGSTVMTATAAAPSYGEGTASNPLSSTLTGDLRVTAKQNGAWAIGDVQTIVSAVGIKGVNGTTIATNANPVPISDAGGSLTVDGTVAISGSVPVTGTFWQATQPTTVTGTLPAFASTPTFNLGTLNGAATASLQASVQTTAGGVGVERGLIYDAAGAPVDWSADVPVISGATPLNVICTSGCSGGGGGGAVTQSTGSTSTPWSVQGTVASGATAGGNPVPIGATYNTTLPTFTTGQRAELQTGSRGSLNVSVLGPDATSVVAVPTTGTDAESNSRNAFLTMSRGVIYNGSNWDRLRGIAGAVSAGTGTLAVANAPTSTSAGAITPAGAGSVSNTVFSATAVNVYSVSVRTAATAGNLMVFNAATVPADGAVAWPALQACIPVAANSYGVWDATTADIPERFTIGLSVAFSSGTTCLTKTATTTEVIRAKFQ